MIRFLSTIAVALGLLAAATFMGCQEPQASPTPASGSTATVDGAEKPSKIELAMAKLSVDDRKLAVAQAVCPVAGEPLGSMGTPIKVVVGDRQLFVCCAGCEEDAKEKFDEYFARLNVPTASPVVE